MTDELSAEESAALEAMQSEPEIVEDVTEVEEDPDEGEATTEPVEAAEEDKPEFKTARDKKPPEGYVPHQAMHEERVKRQEAERQLQAFMAAEQKRAMEAQKAAEPQWVDPLIDPEGFKKYQDYTLGKTQQMVHQQQQALQQRQMQEHRQADVQRAEQEFRRQAPDYDEAINHVAQARVAELRMYGLDDQTIQRQIHQDSQAIYDSARRMGVNPAQLVYQLAQQRGYTPKQAADAASQMEARATAQKQTQGLGSGGSKQSGRLTATQIAEMSEAEIGKLSPDDIARAFGG
jgi:hypothetical protein